MLPMKSLKFVLLLSLEISTKILKHDIICPSIYTVEILNCHREANFIIQAKM